MSALRARLQRDFPGIEYWNYGQLVELGSSDFRNGDHLDDQAARRFTPAFDERLAQWLGAAGAGP